MGIIDIILSKAMTFEKIIRSPTIPEERTISLELDVFRPELYPAIWIQLKSVWMVLNISTFISWQICFCTELGEESHPVGQKALISMLGVS